MVVYLYTVKLDYVNRNSTSVGSKAVNLGEMINAGLPVPPGFVVTNDCFEKFLRANKLENKISEILSKLNFKSYHLVKQASSEIHNLITNATFPDYLEKPIKDEYEELSVGREAKEIGGIALDLIKAGRGEAFVA
ncbi:MAG TPA: hypothetical protein ENG00_00330, partial [Candidatus Aenigmarchaeota archaeon]|nr:hypothetical protein [Candidatus Aenigmarchaeota archaeon]